MSGSGIHVDISEHPGGVSCMFVSFLSLVTETMGKVHPCSGLVALFRHRKGLEVFAISCNQRAELLLSYTGRGKAESTPEVRQSPHVSSPETMFGFKMCLSEGLRGLWKSGGLAYAGRS